MSRIETEIYDKEGLYLVLSLICIILLAEKRKEVRTMSLDRMRSNSQTRSWNRKVDRSQASKMDYYSELRAWVQHELLEAERNQDSKKSDKFLSLLKEL